MATISFEKEEPVGAAVCPAHFVAEGPQDLSSFGKGPGDGEQLQETAPFSKGRAGLRDKKAPLKKGLGDFPRGFTIAPLARTTVPKGPGMQLTFTSRSGCPA